MEEKWKVLYLSIGNMVLALYSEDSLQTLPGTAAFLIRKMSDESDAMDYTGSSVVAADSDNHLAATLIRIWIRSVEKLPEVAGEFLVDDGIFRYFRDGEQYYDLAKPGTDGSVSLAIYPEDFRKINLYVDKRMFQGTIRTADKVIQLLPMKQLLTHYGAFLLHSSRIALKGKAILFTAPSQTGKTTQARLWKTYGGAEIAGNDRTLLQAMENQVITSGYPVDGSSPVYSSRVLPLAAIVVLRQGPINRIKRLSVVLALRVLMEQTALDIGNSSSSVLPDNIERKELQSFDLLRRSAWKAQNFWMKLLENYPVYLLECRPDEGAVWCLRDQLEKDEVMEFGTDIS